MNWTIERIYSYIENKVEENLNLDYKAAFSLEKNEKKTIEISKDVSAFANSDGGIIIYGIKEDKVNRHLPSEIDPIDRNIISKEWLEQIIQGKIRPRVDGILINPIAVNNNSNEVVYVVEIPKSHTAHQADDKKYYKRFNFNSEPMYDYEIRDILNRSKNPEIDIEFKIIKHTYEISKPLDIQKLFTLNKDGIPTSNHPKKEFQKEYKLKIYAKNNGKVLANYINVDLFIKRALLVDNRKLNTEYVQIFADNTIRDVVGATAVPTMNGMSSNPKYGPSRYDPILPRQKMQIETEMLDEKAIDSEENIFWVVYADNAEPRKGQTTFKEIEIIAK